MGSKREKEATASPDSDNRPVHSRVVPIVNRLGLHARPAALFVQTANQYPRCSITVSNGIEIVNGRSIMGVMTLAAGQGTQLILEASGEDAESLLDALSELIAGKFGEE